MKAAFFACIAIGDEPSVRNVVSMVRKISGKGMRTQDALAWLVSYKRETLWKHPGSTRGTPPVLNSSNRETPGKHPGNLRGHVANELELEALSGADANAPTPETAKPKKSQRAPWAPPLFPRERISQTLPEDVNGLQRVAVVFLSEFGNVRDAEKIQDHRPAYVSVLAQIRSRGFSAPDAWQAFIDARLANDEKPLFKHAAKNALSFLPAKLPFGAPPKSEDKPRRADLSKLR